MTCVWPNRTVCSQTVRAVHPTAIQACITQNHIWYTHQSDFKIIKTIGGWHSQDIRLNPMLGPCQFGEHRQAVFEHSRRFAFSATTTVRRVYYEVLKECLWELRKHSQLCTISPKMVAFFSETTYFQQSTEAFPG